MWEYRYENEFNSSNDVFDLQVGVLLSLIANQPGIAEADICFPHSET
jgi:hypothetical protein